MASNKVPPPKNHRVRRIRYSNLKPNTKETIDHIAGMVVDSVGELDFQIRTDCVNVYYRGGSLWKVTNISPRTRGTQIFTDHKYFKRKKEADDNPAWLPEPKGNLNDWISATTRHKKILDGWFEEHNNRERQLQHELAVNHLINTESEWIILDIEYTAWLHGKKENKKDPHTRRSCKYDLIGVKRLDLRNSGILPIYVMELKQGNGSIKGKASIISHAEDMEQLICDPADAMAKIALIDSIKLSFEEKQVLGLLPNVTSEISERDIQLKPAFILEGVDDSDDLNAQKKGAKEILSNCSPSFPWLDYNEMINSKV